ncbi:MAG: hypothetical protein ABSB11_09135 [Sedimentisphaerales bacterium]|jgi:hypothetical protein
MNRLLGLAVIFVVLSLCVPSYGQAGDYFLIYNVATTVNGVNKNSVASIPLKGYLVANLDSDGDLVDANLIMYGKDSLANNMKIYVQLNHACSDPNLNVKMNTWRQGPLFAFDIWDYNDSPFYFEAFVIGKWTLQDIGLTSTMYVASSLKGPISVWDGMLLDPADEIMGTGNVSASLWPAETKLVNQNNWTQDEIINGANGLIQQKLKGYSLAQLPSP